MDWITDNGNGHMGIRNEPKTTVCFIVHKITCYVETERSDQPGFMCKTCFLPFKPYLQLRETLSNISILWKSNCGKNATVAGRKTDECISPRSESFCYLLLLQQLLFRPHSYSQQHQTRSELCQMAQHQLKHRLVTKRLTWRNWTLQSDWRALYRLHGTNRGMAVLPDPFSISPKGVWAQDYMISYNRSAHG